MTGHVSYRTSSIKATNKNLLRASPGSPRLHDSRHLDGKSKKSDSDGQVARQGARSGSSSATVRYQASKPWVETRSGKGGVLDACFGESGAGSFASFIVYAAAMVLAHIMAELGAVMTFLPALICVDQQNPRFLTSLSFIS